MPYEHEKVFREYFEAKSIETITPEALPTVIKNRFESMSKRFILPDQYTEGDFEMLLSITQLDGTKQYAALQTRQYPPDQYIEGEPVRPGKVERLIYVAEERGGELVGNGEIRFALFDTRGFFKNKPFVGWTETAESARREWIGIRRLELMNALSQAEYGLPLYSDIRQIGDGEQTRVWEWLVTHGEARPLPQKDGRIRFVFNVKRAPQELLEPLII